ncbi:hypothetical protein INR49_031013 [Caranx melampygus]|nr:hypothetical protein INR49_031013 [Caranx melampygus]
MLLLLLLLLSGWSQSNPLSVLALSQCDSSLLPKIEQVSDKTGLKKGGNCEKYSIATTLVVTAVPPAQLCHPHQNTVLSLIATEMIDCTKHSNFELIHLKGELKKEEDESSFQENLTAHRLLRSEANECLGSSGRLSGLD